MLDEETFEAMRALHIAFVEGRDFPILVDDEPASAEIDETSWSNNFRSMIMIGATLTIVCSVLYLYLSVARRRQKSFEATIKWHPRPNEESV